MNNIHTDCAGLMRYWGDAPYRLHDYANREVRPFDMFGEMAEFAETRKTTGAMYVGQSAPMPLNIIYVRKGRVVENPERRPE